MRVHHLAFRTGSVEELARFYEEVLGLRRLREQGGRAVWLAIGDAVLMVERAEPGEPAVPDGSQELVAFRVDSEERAAVQERLARLGVAEDGETDHTTYFRDPDGRRVAVSTHPLVG